jgi:hypothetical protein
MGAQGNFRKYSKQNTVKLLRGNVKINYTVAELMITTVTVPEITVTMLTNELYRIPTDSNNVLLS